MTINEKIKADRLKKGYSHSGYAEKIGVSRRALIYWERGQRIHPLMVDGIEKAMKKIKKKT